MPSASHQLGNAKREIKRLSCVQPRIAKRLVAEVELGPANRLGAAEACGDILAREREMHPAGPRADLAVRGEKAFQLVQDLVEPPRLATARRDAPEAVHRIARPDDG